MGLTIAGRSIDYRSSDRGRIDSERMVYDGCDKVLDSIYCTGVSDEDRASGREALHTIVGVIVRLST